MNLPCLTPPCRTCLPPAQAANGKGILRQMKFSADRPTTFAVWDLRHALPYEASSLGPAPVLYTAPAAWAYHQIHCFEEEAPDGSTTLTLDLAAYEDASTVNGPHGYAYLENMRDPKERVKQVCAHRFGCCVRHTLHIQPRPTPCAFAWYF
jgi:hypothetical protein